jgi:hypothetical protein
MGWGGNEAGELRKQPVEPLGYGDNNSRLGARR